MAERRRSSRLMMPKTPRFWPEMKTRCGLVVAAIDLVNIGAIDGAAGELLGGVHDGSDSVCVVRSAGPRLCLKHELAAVCTGTL